MAVPAPPIQWVGAHPNNFYRGRQYGRDGRSTKHWIVGPLSSADATFNNPGRQASAHFGVGQGVVHQYVDINDTAYADGNWDSNTKSITVEHEGGPALALTDAMYELAAWLHAWLKENYGVTYSVRHRDVSQAATACPGTLDVERIENRANQLIAQYNKPKEQPEWIRNRQALAITVYAQNDGLRIINLDDTSQFADSRSFARNTSFEIGSQTIVNGTRYYITKSSTDLNKPNGIRATEVAETPWSPPVVVPPAPTTPKWDDALVDDANRPMYVLRETPLINLEDGKPKLDKNGNQIIFKAGDVIADVSAHTIVAGVTYNLTEYSFSKRIASGIRANDLSLDPQSTPPGTPANPIEDRLSALEKLVQKIKDFINSLFKGANL